MAHAPPSLDAHLYGEERQRKLRTQQHRDAADGQLQGLDTFFAGVVVYVNGHVVPTKMAIQNLLNLHGGLVRNNLCEEITHIVATALPDAKIKHLLQIGQRAPPVVSGAWVVDSVAAGGLVDVQPYLSIDQLSVNRLGFARAAVPSAVGEPLVAGVDGSGNGDGGEGGDGFAGGDGFGGRDRFEGRDGFEGREGFEGRDESEYVEQVSTRGGGGGEDDVRHSRARRADGPSAGRGDASLAWAAAVAASSSPRVFCEHCQCVPAPLFVAESFADARAALVQWVERVEVPTAWHTRLVCVFVRDMIHARRPVDVVNLLRFLSRRGDVWKACAKGVARDTTACCVGVFGATLMW